MDYRDLPYNTLPGGRREAALRPLPLPLRRMGVTRGFVINDFNQGDYAAFADSVIDQAILACDGIGRTRLAESNFTEQPCQEPIYLPLTASESPT